MRIEPISSPDSTGAAALHAPPSAHTPSAPEEITGVACVRIEPISSAPVVRIGVACVRIEPISSPDSTGAPAAPAATTGAGAGAARHWLAQTSASASGGSVGPAASR